MTSTKFAILSVIAILGACGIFGLPSSAWWDTGVLAPKILLGASIAGWIYVLYEVIKNISSPNKKV